MLLQIALLFLNLFIQPDSAGFNELLLREDSQLRLTLLYKSSADISEITWLKLKIANKTASPIKVTRASYSIDKESGNEKPMNWHTGWLGRDISRYQLFHCYDDPSDRANRPMATVIEPGVFIVDCNYISNYATALMRENHIGKTMICALFQSKIEYEFEEEHFELKAVDGRFCFEWTNSALVEKTKLEDRLRTVLLNPKDDSYGGAVVGKLMGIKAILSRISTDELTQAVVLREQNPSNVNIYILRELERRNAAPSQQLLDSYTRRFSKDNIELFNELKYFWDNRLLPAFLDSDIQWRRVHKTLEIHADAWRTNPENTKLVYEYLREQLNFEPNGELARKDYRQWATDIKYIATSRQPEFIAYLAPFLDNEKQFTAEDWSAYRHYGYRSRKHKPEKVKLRVCDAAFVALLRATNQITYALTSGPDPFVVSVANDIIPKELSDTYNLYFISSSIGMGWCEKEIKLTPELKVMMKEHIRRLLNSD